MNNFIDSVVSFFNPQAGLKRARSRQALDVLRAYDISSMGRRTTGWNRPRTTGAQEVSKGFEIGAASAQELGRNNALASRIKNVWANNAVAAGIQLEVASSAAKKAERFNTEWDDWAESKNCDFEGHYNFYGLQWLWVTTIVESGGVFIRRHVNAAMKFPLQLQTLEQSQLDRYKNSTNIIDGIEYTEKGQVKGYWFMVDKTNSVPVSTFIKKSEIVHIFKKDRVGQHLGMTWLSTIANLLRNYETYKDAKLMQQQIAACFALVVEGANSEIGSIAGTTKTDGSKELPDAIEPGMIEYVGAGSVPHTISPPKADNSSAFDVGLKRDAAAGAGLTYEQLSGDYSLVNFASGRMGRSEFYLELDFVQHLMLKPNLGEVFKWFDGLYQIKFGAGRFIPDWTFPPRAAVNPVEEFDVLMSKVRHGMLSPTKAAKILGERLEKVVEQWNKDKDLFGELPFDIDPSKFAATGNQLDDNDAASSNTQSTTTDKGDE